MATGWQRQFIVANRQSVREWNEKCFREDIQAGKITGKTPFDLANEYDLAERQVKRILTEYQIEHNRTSITGKT